MKKPTEMISRESSPPSAAAPSFRDPAGCLCTVEGRLLRIVARSGLPYLEAFLTSGTAQKFAAAGRLAQSRVLDTAEAQKLLAQGAITALFESTDGAAVVEHEPIAFPSFPYEWPPEMLHAAACLTLDFAEELVAEGLGLKDATPYNVLFRGSEPVFVDILSIERRDPGDPVWLPYAQCVRAFLLPLLVNQRFRTPLDQLLTTRRDGLEPQDVYALCGPMQKLLPPFLTLVSIPTWLAARHKQDDTSLYQKKSLDDPEQARFILESVIRGLRRKLDALAPRGGRKSVWSDYMAGDHNYAPEHFRAKHTFVESVLAEFRPSRVLDVGCNTGTFSALAARRGASVVAMDSDPVVVGQVWRQARAEALDILPLVVNLTRPSPAIGWRNQECPAFLDRARGAFDTVLMLAVVHHMLVSERIPLPEIIDLAAELTTRFLVIEFVAPDDPMFRRITRGRDDLFRGLTRELFEATCRRHFELVRSQHLDQTSRWLYLLSKSQ